MNQKMEQIKIDIGSGRMKKKGFIGIDLTQCIDGKGNNTVDIVMDVCTGRLPYGDNEVDEIACYNTLEHLPDMKFALNEMHRVMKISGKLHGNVPICGTKSHWQDPTHLRCFIKETFGYFTGKADWDPTKPSHPRYADYGYKPWNLIELTTSENGEMLNFKMSPRKV